MYAGSRVHRGHSRIKAGLLARAAGKLLDLPADDLTIKSGITTSRSSNETQVHA